MKRFWTLAWRILVSALIFAVLVATTAREVGWLGEDPFWEFWPVVAVGALAFSEAIAATAREVQRPAKERYAANVRAIAVGLSKTVADTTGVSPMDVGVSVYVVGRRRFIFWPPLLKRVVRQRLSNSPLPSGITWTKAKGAIGQAWAGHAQVHTDWTQVIQVWNASTRDEAAFISLDAQYRTGLNFDEFRVIVDKYGEILATPILEENGGRCFGVVAVELPHTVPNVGTLLDTSTVRETTAQTAALLRGVVGGE